MAHVPPVEKGGFSYAADSLCCVASNLTSHRRATIPELKAHFGGKDTENRTAHWYEAQLIHYGLPPSKVKGTAHKRLFDALMSKGGLTVPAHIAKIEADLKKEWAKKEREAKKVTKASLGAAAAPAKGTKRKAEQASTNVSVNVSVQISRTGAVKVDTAQPAAKRAKASGPSSSTTTPKKTTAIASKAKKTTSTKFQGSYDDDLPLPYDDLTQDHTPQFSPRQSIGILNGRYRVSCPYLEDNFPEYKNDCGLIATLDGNNLWLKFDFGAASGLIKADRPYEPSEDAVGVFWRGHALDAAYNSHLYNVDTIHRAGPVNRLHFLGGGHIEGKISYDRHEVDFDAYRLAGQSMTSEISPAQARAEWARLERNDDMFW